MDVLLSLLLIGLIVGLILAVRRPVIVMDCPVCGRTISYHSRRCQYCGEEMAGHLIKKCPDCSRLFPAAMSYCPLCSSKLKLK